MNNVLAVLKQLSSLEYHAGVRGLHRVWQHDRTIRTALLELRKAHCVGVLS